MDILHRDELPQGGFAGLREHQLVMDARVFGHYRQPASWPGLGQFVYLADARFLPRGETGMHPHREIDVISVMNQGRIIHQGSLEHGVELVAYEVQVQRAGGEGFRHNEVNPDDAENRMIQMWALPQTRGGKAGYKRYQPQWGECTRIYGGPEGQDSAYPAETIIESALLSAEQTCQFGGPFMAYVVQGSGLANGKPVKNGDLLRGHHLKFTAENPVQLIVVYLLPKQPMPIS